MNHHLGRLIHCILGALCSAGFLAVASGAFGFNTATTGDATSITATSATLHGKFNIAPHSGAVWFEYGPSTAYGTMSPVWELGPSFQTDVPASYTAANLTPNTLYHFRIVATNYEGVAYGMPKSFKTLAGPPTPTTLAASDLTTGAATLNGLVNPNNSIASKAWFQYGLTGSYGSNTIPRLVGVGANDIPFSANVTSLLPGQVYHFRLVATNESGVAFGNDQTFLVPSARPAVFTGGASQITSASAILNGIVEPNGSASRVWFEYGGNQNYGSMTPASEAGQSARFPAQATVSSLRSNTVYHFRLVATNSRGITYGSDQAFTTFPNPPAVRIKVPTDISSSSAILWALVNPHGAETTLRFEYDLSPTFTNSTSKVLEIGSGSIESMTTTAVAGLVAGETYFYRAIATNSEGTSFSETLSFVARDTIDCATSYNEFLSKLAMGGSIYFSCDRTFVVTNTLTISRDVLLDASGYNVVLRGYGQRILNIEPGVSFRANNFTVTGGFHTPPSSATALGLGGALYNRGGIVHLARCTFSNNVAGGSSAGRREYVAGGGAAGGAIYSSGGSVFVDSCRFVSNQIRSGNSGFYHPDVYPRPDIVGPATGGAIYMNNGTLIVTNCVFLGNSASSYAFYTQGLVNGGAIFCIGGTLACYRSRFIGNQLSLGGAAAGGALYNENGSSFLDGCEFANNMASSIPSAFDSRQSLAADGGALLHTSGSMVMNNCAFLGNTTLAGNGVSGRPRGGDARGGAIYLPSATSYLTNITVSGNISEGGRSYDASPTTASGGGIANSGPLTLVNCTIVSNAALAPVSSGGNLSGSAKLINTIVANTFSLANCSGPFTGGADSLQWPGNSCGPAIPVQDPQLGTLANHGGFTPNYALSPGSPAIDAGDSAACPDTDQRGVLRPLGTRCDIGAHEFGGYLLNLVAESGGVIRITVPMAPHQSFTLQTSSNLVDWAEVGFAVSDDNGWATFQTNRSMNSQQQFFRLVIPQDM